jgi:hypothetical protein
MRIDVGAPLGQRGVPEEAGKQPARVQTQNPTMDRRALARVWTAGTDEKPLLVSVTCLDGDASFGTIQAEIARLYALAHPDRAALCFWPKGPYVATNAAREPVFYADQKVPPLFTSRPPRGLACLCSFHVRPFFSALYACTPRALCC